MGGEGGSRWGDCACGNIRRKMCDVLYARWRYLLDIQIPPVLCWEEPDPRCAAAPTARECAAPPPRFAAQFAAQFAAAAAPRRLLSVKGGRRHRCLVVPSPTSLLVRTSPVVASAFAAAFAPPPSDFYVAHRYDADLYCSLDRLVALFFIPLLEVICLLRGADHAVPD